MMIVSESDKMVPAFYYIEFVQGVYNNLEGKLWSPPGSEFTFPMDFNSDGRVQVRCPINVVPYPEMISS